MPANIKTIELRNLQIEDYKELKNQWWNPIQKWLIPLERRSNRTLLKKNSPGTISNCSRQVSLAPHYALLVTEDFAFKTRTYKPLLAILPSRHTIKMEKFIRIDVFINP
jgi:hypothetical protein